MTDKEIIKALECCSANSVDACQNCAYRKGSYANGCAFQLSGDALDLISRQQAEIERLRKTHIFLDYPVEEIKTEAIKEFAERLKEELVITDNSNWIGVTEHYLVWTIDNLVKEMVGEDDAHK